MFNFLQKFIFIGVILTLLFGFSNTAKLQESDPLDNSTIPAEITWEDVEQTMNQLQIYHSGFMAVRDEFFIDQSSGNKTRYHKAGQDWAKHIVEANLLYINYMQADLYNKLTDKSSLTEFWLSDDRDMLMSYQAKIDQSKDYVALRSLMDDYLVDWSEVVTKMNHVKVLVFLNNIDNIVMQTQKINEQLNTKQQLVKQALTTAGVVVDLSVFEQVLETYNAKLVDITSLLATIKGDINQPKQYTSLATDDSVWQTTLSQIKEIKTALTSLSVLQENSIAQFIDILNTTVQPVNKSL